jgi:hypothetical protein
VNVGLKARIAADDLGDCRHGVVIVRVRIDAHPQFARVDVNHPVRCQGATDVGTDILDAGHFNQLGTDAGGDALHLGQGDAWCSLPADQ